MKQQLPTGIPCIPFPSLSASSPLWALARVLILANVDAHSSNPASSKEAVSHADSNQGQPGKASRNAAPFNLTIVSLSTPLGRLSPAQPSPPCRLPAVSGVTAGSAVGGSWEFVRATRE
jgi:hypothetical protein